jgi:hypothetical protein
MLVSPRGRRYRRYNYRFNGKQKTLALGISPLERARPRTGQLAMDSPLAQIRPSGDDNCEQPLNSEGLLS